MANFYFTDSQGLPSRASTSQLEVVSLPIDVAALRRLLLHVAEVEGDVEVDQVLELLFLTRRVELGVDGPETGLHDDQDVRQGVTNLRKQVRFFLCGTASPVTDGFDQLLKLNCCR